MVHAKDVLSDQLLANANDPSWYLTIFGDSVENCQKKKHYGSLMKIVIASLK